MVLERLCVWLQQTKGLSNRGFAGPRDLLKKIPVKLRSFYWDLFRGGGLPEGRFHRLRLAADGWCQRCVFVLPLLVCKSDFDDVAMTDDFIHAAHGSAGLPRLVFHAAGSSSVRATLGAFTR